MWNREQLSSCSDHLAQSLYLPPRLPRMHPCSTWPWNWDDRAGRGRELGGIHFRHPTSAYNVYFRDCMSREMRGRQLHYKWRQNSWQCEGCQVPKRALQEQTLEYWFRDSGYDPPHRPVQSTVRRAAPATAWSSTGSACCGDGLHSISATRSTEMLR
jgi:hypothetical protein